jgi:hypothetical protein
MNQELRTQSVYTHTHHITYERKLLTQEDLRHTAIPLNPIIHQYANRPPSSPQTRHTKGGRRAKKTERPDFSTRSKNPLKPRRARSPSE